MKPVMLLDLDGVINAIGDLGPDLPLKDWKRGTACSSPGNDWPIRWSPTTVAFLNDIHARGLVEIRWHTTWQIAAWNVSDLVGLPRFDIAVAPENNWDQVAMKRRWWKLPAALRVEFEENRPLIWCDDDISWQLGPESQKALRANGRVLLVSPSQETGLAPRHYDKINKFLSYQWS